MCYQNTLPPLRGEACAGGCSAGRGSFSRALPTHRLPALRRDSEAALVLLAPESAPAPAEEPFRLGALLSSAQWVVLKELCKALSLCLVFITVILSSVLSCHSLPDGCV